MGYRQLIKQLEMAVVAMIRTDRYTDRQKVATGTQNTITFFQEKNKSIKTQNHHFRTYLYHIIISRQNEEPNPPQAKEKSKKNVFGIIV